MELRGVNITNTNIIAGSGGPAPSGDSVIGFAEMGPPIVPGDQLEDGTATINGTTGFTINNDGDTGVAPDALTANNVSWFTTNYTVIPGNYTCTWGPGSTVASSTINVVALSGTQIVFYIQGQSGPATYNYPFTFSV